MVNPSPFDALIIGGGASGVLVATHLLRKGVRRIGILEPRESLGQGIAYGTSRMEHKLNVRAKGMTGDPSNPGDFIAWLDQNGHPADPDSFAPRPLFAKYLQDRLREAGEVTHIQSKAIRLEPGFHVATAEGAYQAPQVVVATGNLPPVNPSGLRDVAMQSGFLHDPWSTNLAQIGPEDEVLIVGSGLTMIDLVLELLATGHRGKVNVVSRRGLLPHRHEHVDPIKFSLGENLSVREWVKAVRAEAKTQPWRSVIDSLRAQTPALWQSLSESERARFLRHLVPYWDAHRHRIDPNVADAADRADVHQLAGWITGARPGFEVDVHHRWGGETTLTPKWILLATGPRFGSTSPFLGDAELTPDGEVVGQPGLYAMGPLLKSAGWETTAIPEIRVQATRVADRISNALSTATP